MGVGLLCMMLLTAQSYVMNKKIFCFSRTGSQYMWVISNASNPNFTGMLILGNIYTGSYSYCHKNIPIMSSAINRIDIENTLARNPKVSHVLLERTLDSDEAESTLLERGFVSFRKDAQVIYFKKRNLYN
jgi:hypothetical protein